MVFLQKLKRDIARNRGKAAVLAALFLVMVLFAVRAVIQLRPAEALPVTPVGMGAGPTNPENRGALDETDGVAAEARIKESQELWARLREVKTDVSTSLAFAFDPSYFPEDPTRKVVIVQPEPVPQVVPVSPVENPEAIRRAHEATVRDVGRGLKVSSVTISSKPWAIVNQQQVSMGDLVFGFQVTAIRPQEVEFNKEGVTIAVQISDDHHGP